MARLFPPVPEMMQFNANEWMHRLAQAINAMLNGRHNATGTVTLTANVTTTTLTDARLFPGSHISFTAQTATAAGAVGGFHYAITAAGGAATITHASTAATDKTFSYDIAG